MSEPTTGGELQPRPAPHSLWELARAFNRLALQGFGGVLAVAQRELVERLGWLSRDEFVEMLAVAQVLPGPNVVNMALMVGDSFFGLRGAFAALAGIFVVPCVIVMSLAIIAQQLLVHPAMAGALRGMGAVSAGLILGTGIKLLSSLKSNPLGLGLSLALAAGTFVAIALGHWPLIWIVIGLGGLGMAGVALQLRKNLESIAK